MLTALQGCSAAQFVLIWMALALVRSSNCWWKKCVLKCFAIAHCFVYLQKNIVQKQKNVVKLLFAHIFNIRFYFSYFLIIFLIQISETTKICSVIFSLFMIR